MLKKWMNWRWKTWVGHLCVRSWRKKWLGLCLRVLTTVPQADDCQEGPQEGGGLQRGTVVMLTGCMTFCKRLLTLGLSLLISK